MEFQWHLPIARYGEGWRRGRKLLDRSLRPGAAVLYRPMQQARVHVLLTRLLATPDEWQDHIELCETIFIVTNDIFIHRVSLQLPRRTYFRYDVWVRGKGEARQKAGRPKIVYRIFG